MFGFVHLWGWASVIHTGVCEQNIPFVQALATQPGGKNCVQAPDRTRNTQYEYRLWGMINCTAVYLRAGIYSGCKAWREDDVLASSP